MIEYIELGNDGEPVTVQLTEQEAIELSRASFRRNRPNRADPRSDAEALDEFMVVHWATKEQP
jgi:hypothetical protein